MNIKSRFRKPESVVWTHFTRRGDAIFLSLRREVRIGVLSVATLAAACPDSAAAIMAYSQATVPTEDKEELELTLNDAEVVGTLAPLPADKAVRLVQVINRQDIEATSAHSVNDLLKLVAGVDVRQRGGFGIQTDIGVNGGTEDQLTDFIIVLNSRECDGGSNLRHHVALHLGLRTKVQ